MSDIKLFHLHNQTVTELDGRSVAIEKSLQNLIEQHLETFLGIRFLATEHTTGHTHGGRIDTLGLDENNCPVIIEYKRSLNENVINQGLFYLDWLLDHKAEFRMLVMDTLGPEASKAIDWSSPRLLCIAGDFTRYDEHAVRQINRNIELIRYKRFGDDLLLLDLVNAITEATPQAASANRKGTDKGTTNNESLVAKRVASAPQEMRDRYEALKSYMVALGDDVQIKTLKHYIAFRRLKNFACVELFVPTNQIVLTLKVDPTTVELEPGFSRDVSKTGHHGTGDLEIAVRSDEDVEKVKPFLLRSYESA